jgi:16S rRNA (uracil1498-N3)-methyltransferase
LTAGETRARLDELRRAATLVYVDDVEAPAVDATDAHHLRHTLRLGPSETVVACDGLGSWRACRLAAPVTSPASGTGVRRRRGDKHGPSETAGSVLEPLEPVGPILCDARPDQPVTVAFAITKGDRPEWTVQKLTELGVDEIVPLVTARTIVRLGPEELQRRAGRLRRVAREAGSQCRRTHLPAVHEPTSFAFALTRLPHSAQLAEPGGEALCPTTTAVLVGPEGGWDPAELACGLGTLDLGPTVLRADTAALVAAVLLGAQRAEQLRRAAGQ